MYVYLTTWYISSKQLLDGFCHHTNENENDHIPTLPNYKNSLYLKLLKSFSILPYCKMIYFITSELEY